MLGGIRVACCSRPGIGEAWELDAEPIRGMQARALHPHGLRACRAVGGVQVCVERFPALVPRLRCYSPFSPGASKAYYWTGLSKGGG